MKKTLLSLALSGCALFALAQVQQLPLNENFNIGDLSTPGWETSINQNAINIAPYSIRNASNVCTNDPYGAILNPGTINPQNRAAFVTPVLSAINGNSEVIFRFSYFFFNSPNNFTCATQAPCTATVQVYLVPSTYTGVALPPANQIYGQSGPVPINTTNFESRAVITVPVTANLTNSTNFRVMFDIVSVGNCGNPRRYGVDNIFVDAQEEIVTPVSFKAFTASRKNNGVALTWTTASEQNNQGFRIERNLGSAWEEIAFIPSAADGGNSATDLSYNFTDANSAKGISQYRIKQVDLDGQFSYSDIRSVRGSGSANIVVYPNPSPNGKTTIMFDEDNVVRDVFVSDGQGRILKQYRQTTDNSLVIEQLAKGFYTIRVVNRTTGSSFVEKLVVN